jgi:hypothetical protein
MRVPWTAFVTPYMPIFASNRQLILDIQTTIKSPTSKGSCCSFNIGRINLSLTFESGDEF